MLPQKNKVLDFYMRSYGYLQPCAILIKVLLDCLEMQFHGKVAFPSCRHEVPKTSLLPIHRRHLMFQHSNQKYEGVNFGTQDLRYGELLSCTFNRCLFSNGSLEEITSSKCRFIECDFRGASLNGSIHKETAFENCNFNGANLFVSKFEICKMTGSDFSGSNMDGITIFQGDWSYTNLRNTRLVKQDLRGVKFHEADLSAANLEKADLRDCDLTMAILAKAKLQGTDVRGAKMEGVDFKTFTITGMRMDREQSVLFALSHGAKVG